MTQKKRFRISRGYTNVFCHDWENNKLLGFEQTVDCLNTFYEENKKLKQQIDELEFRLRTIEAYDRTAKEEHSDTVYDFKKKLEKW